MHLGAKPKFQSCFKNPLCILYSEKTLFTKYINVIGKFFFRNSGNHLPDYLIHIFFTSTQISPRDGVCTEKCLFYSQGSLLTYHRSDMKHFYLIFQRETISALYLDSTRSETYNLLHPRHCLTKELLLGCIMQ